MPVERTIFIKKKYNNNTRQCDVRLDYWPLPVAEYARSRPQCRHMRGKKIKISPPPPLRIILSDIRETNSRAQKKKWKNKNNGSGQKKKTVPHDSHFDSHRLLYLISTPCRLESIPLNTCVIVRPNSTYNICPDVGTKIDFDEKPKKKQIQ